MDRSMSPASPSTRRPSLAAGIFLIALTILTLGIFLLRDLYYPATDRSVPEPLQSLLFLAPVLIAWAERYRSLALSGCCKIAALSGANRRTGTPRRSAKGFELFFGIVAALNIYPCWWLGILSRLKGERPGNEGEGMGGFFLMVMFGLPSLVWRLTTSFVCCGNTKEGAANEHAFAARGYSGEMPTFD